MRKLAAVIVLTLLLTGCTGAESELDRAAALRTKLLAASGCSFDAEITADYGEGLYTFTLSCVGDQEGGIDFTVRSPETIAGITGRVTHSKGKLTFDGLALDIPLLAEGVIAPLTAPWLLTKALRGGYITSAGAEGELLRLNLSDSLNGEPLSVDLWLDNENRPVRGEILHEGRRYLTLTVNNFELL